MPHRPLRSSFRTKRVLILGGGFGGIGAARKLHDAHAHVTIVDANDYHSFQPMLYQLATGLVETAAVAHSLRDLFHNQPNANVNQAVVAAIDLDRREVEFEDMPPLRYDYLVTALGAEVEFFGTEGAAEKGFPLYTVADAVRLKDHIVQAWESADRDPRLVRDGALNVVIVGGGATGIESAGALAELYNGDFVADFPNLPVDEARLILVEAGPDLFPTFERDIREYTAQALEERGVEIIVGERVTRIRSSGAPVFTQVRPWRHSASSSSVADVLRWRRISASPATRRHSQWATPRGSPTATPARPSHSSARSRCSPASTPG